MLLLLLETYPTFTFWLMRTPDLQQAENEEQDELQPALLTSPATPTYTGCPHKAYSKNV